MALDVNEVLANSIIGLIGLALSWVGARVNRFLAKLNKAEKDLNAVFPKLRRIEAHLGLKETCHASQPVRANGSEAPHGSVCEPGDDSYALRSEQKNDDIQA